MTPQMKNRLVTLGVLLAALVSVGLAAEARKAPRDEVRLAWGTGALNDLPRLHPYQTASVSSSDPAGRNIDFTVIRRGETFTLANLKGPGCIRHIWIAISDFDKFYLRKMTLRMYWDEEKDPSVDVPLGDFFGVGHAIASPFYSLPLDVVVGSGQVGGNAAFNSFFPMPFAKSARIEIVNQADWPTFIFGYQIDYDIYPALENDIGYFHAKWHRENPTRGKDLSKKNALEQFFSDQNLTGNDNYVILDATGEGTFVGTVLSVDNLTLGEKAPQIGGHPFEWWGEGDMMIFIDGRKWPPNYLGTGTEDYFAHAWGMQNLTNLFFGTSLPETDPSFPGRHKVTAYRFHIQDPIVFHKSIRVTIEHGAANSQSNDYSSVAYWYQREPHKPWAAMPPVSERIPRPDPTMPQTPSLPAPLESAMQRTYDKLASLTLAMRDPKNKFSAEQAAEIFTVLWAAVPPLVKQQKYEQAQSAVGQAEASIDRMLAAIAAEERK